MNYILQIIGVIRKNYNKLLYHIFIILQITIKSIALLFFILKFK